MKARHAVLPGRCGVVFGLVAALVCLFGGRARSAAGAEVAAAHPDLAAEILARLQGAGPGAETPFGKRDDLRYFLNLAEAFAGAAMGASERSAGGAAKR